MLTLVFGSLLECLADGEIVETCIAWWRAWRRGVISCPMFTEYIDLKDKVHSMMIGRFQGSTWICTKICFERDCSMFGEFTDLLI